MHLYSDSEARLLLFCTETANGNVRQYFLEQCTEARVLMHPDMYNTLLTIAIEEPEKRARNQKVWAGLSTLNSELLKPMLNPADATERLAKSEIVQDKATAFVAAFTDVCGVENATLYCHEVVTHIQQPFSFQISTWLGDCSMEDFGLLVTDVSLRSSPRKG
jgi:hypothetical protein